MNYMGIDHHNQYSHITLLDEKGEKLKSGRVSNLRSELENFLLGIEEVKAVVEAGCSSYTMVDPLDEIGIDVTIAQTIWGEDISRQDSQGRESLAALGCS